MLPLLEEHTTHLEPPTQPAQLSIDWGFARGTAAELPAAHDRAAADAKTALLLGAGAVAGAAGGKAAAGAAAAAVGKGAAGVAGSLAAGAAGKAVAAASSKALAGKLASPFVAKAASAVGGAVAGGTAAAGSGLVGAALGAGVGLTVDIALAKGLELARRPELERDVAAAVSTAQSEWRQRCTEELARAVDVWVDDALQLTGAWVDTALSADRDEDGAAHHSPRLGGVAPETGAPVDRGVEKIL